MRPGQTVKLAKEPGVVDATVEMLSRIPFIEAEMKKHQKPPGFWKHVSPLLDARRLEMAIPNGAFTRRAQFDRILVWQIPDSFKETFVEDGVIVKTGLDKLRENQETPRGVIVSAGLKALDELRSNGMDVGHIVNFIRLAPWRIVVDTVAGVDFVCLVLRVGDLIASDDIVKALEKGECSIQYDEETAQHKYLDKDGKTWSPVVPWIPEDY